MTSTWDQQPPEMGVHPRILIIDDDLVDRRAIRRAMRSTNTQAEVGEADSIDAAWQKIEEGPWDCVFLDYMLPGGDGLELLKQFREKGHQMPIVVVTSQGDEKVAVQVMKAGGSDYLTKNLLSSEAVAATVQRAIRSHQVEIERQRTAEALADSEARLAEAQRIAKIGSWESDPVTLEEFWTDQVLAIFEEEGRGNCKMGRRKLRHHFHPDDLERCMEGYFGVVNNLVASKLDARIITKSGKIVQVEIQAKAVVDAEGKLVKVVGTIQDISSRKAYEEALRDAKNLAEHNAKAKEEFLANMSHEIRTPMNAILGFAKLLQDTPLDARQREFLRAIDTSGEALLSIINDILDISKIDAGKMWFEDHPFSLQSVLEDLQEIFGGKADEKKIEFITMVGPDVPDELVGDAGKLRQVLLNLVSNALKFTEAGEVNVEVKLLEGSPTGVRLLFEVTDTGIGIPAEKLDSIFESFTQASSDTTRKYGGTGLGLTICKRIVELQGGHIGLESVLGEGSTFRFDLQFALAQQAQNASSVAAATIAHDGDLPPLLVLLAEDNPLNQRLATIVLEQMGFSYLVASNGQEAVEMVSQARPDIVLMDIQMPLVDGYEATRKIRQLQDKSLSTLPIIALTAHALAEEADKCRQAGMDGFIAKPFQAAQLKAQIIQLVAGNDHSHKAFPSPAIQNAGSLDLQKLNELVGDNAQFRKELVAIFLQEVPKAMTQLEAALAAGDPRQLYLVAHAIKPSLILFGVPEAGKWIGMLEAHEKATAISAEASAAVAALVSLSRDACTTLQA